MRGLELLLAPGPVSVFIESVKILSPTYVKARIGRVLDEAVQGRPQFVMRGGAVVMLSRLDIEVENRPPGFFADAYAKPDRERDALERSMAKVKQQVDR